MTTKKTNVTKSSGAVTNNVVASTPTVGPVVTTGAPAGASSSASSGAASSTPLSSIRTVGGFRQKLQAMLAGVQSMLPADSTVPTVGAAPLKAADIASEIQNGLAAYAAVDQQVTVLAQARLALKGDIPGLKTFYAEVKQALITFYGKNAPALAHYGLGKAPRKLNSTQQVVRVTRSNETRSLRHTQGTRQKAAVKFLWQVALATQGNASGTAPATGSSAQSAPVTPAAATSGPAGAPVSPPSDAVQS